MTSLRRLLPALAVLLAQCGDSSTPTPGSDASVEVPRLDANDGDVVGAGADRFERVEGSVSDGSEPVDNGPMVEADGTTPGDAVPGDEPIALDAGVASDAEAMTDDTALSPDQPLVEDIPMATDLPPVDAPPSRDAGPMCPLGLADDCAMTVPGPCPPLVSGVPQVVRFTGFNASITASCEGTLTRNARDGVVPVVLTAPSDLTVTAQPWSGDVAVVAVYRGDACGLLSGELRCANGNSPGAAARTTLTSLEPGVYMVGVSALAGNPVTLTATVSPARPRRRGDVCPGVPITPDAVPISLSTNGFQPSSDYGTTCGAGGAGAGWVDAVFAYTLATPRDVTLQVSSNSGDVAVDVTSTCGARSASVPPCQSGSMVRRVIRNQPAGTWYVTVEHRANSGGRTLTASVSTATPSPVDPADRCPGAALGAEGTASVEVSRLGGDALLGCVRNQRADGFFTFTAPPANRDVLVNLRGNGSEGLGFALQSPCGRSTVGSCQGTAERAVANLWGRYRGLSPGNDYTIAAGTSQTSGNLAVRVLSVPAVSPTVSANANTACARATAIPPEGGVFTGSNAGGDRVFTPLCNVGGCLGGRAVFYRLALTERRRVVLNTAGSGFDTFVNVFAGDCPGRPLEGACSDDAIGAAALVDTTLDAGNYVVMLSGCGANAQGAYTLDAALLAP